MVFQYATLVFSTPEPIFGHPDPRSGSWRVPAGLGTFFAQKRGPGKHEFVVEMVPHRGLRGICARGLDCMVPRRPLGRPISPQTLPEKHFTGISPIPEKILGPPWHPLAPGGFPIGPLKELLPILPPAALFPKVRYQGWIVPLIAETLPLVMLHVTGPWYQAQFSGLQWLQGMGLPGSLITYRPTKAGGSGVV